MSRFDIPSDVPPGQDGAGTPMLAPKEIPPCQKYVVRHYDAELNKVVSIEHEAHACVVLQSEGILRLVRAYRDPEEGPIQVVVACYKEWLDWREIYEPASILLFPGSTD